MNNEFQDRLKARVIDLASEYGHSGYKQQVTERLNIKEWDVGKDHVFSIWRKEGLKAPIKQPKKSRLWLNDGKKIKILNIIDEYFR